MTTPKATPRLTREQIEARLDELRELVKHLTLHPYAASAHAWIKQRREELNALLAALAAPPVTAPVRHKIHCALVDQGNPIVGACTCDPENPIPWPPEPVTAPASTQKVVESQPERTDT